MTTNNQVGVRAHSFTGLLTIVLITLKLTGIIAWSWWVLAGLWLPFVVVLTLSVLFGVGALLMSLITGHR